MLLSRQQRSTEPPKLLNTVPTHTNPILRAIIVNKTLSNFKQKIRIFQKYYYLFQDDFKGVISFRVPSADKAVHASVHNIVIRVLEVVVWDRISSFFQVLFYA